MTVSPEASPSVVAPFIARVPVQAKFPTFEESVKVHRVLFPPASVKVKTPASPILTKGEPVKFKSTFVSARTGHLYLFHI